MNRGRGRWYSFVWAATPFAQVAGECICCLHKRSLALQRKCPLLAQVELHMCAHLPTIGEDQFLMGRGPVMGHGLGVGDPCSNCPGVGDLCSNCQVGVYCWITSEQPVNAYVNETLKYGKYFQFLNYCIWLILTLYKVSTGEKHY